MSAKVQTPVATRMAKPSPRKIPQEMIDEIVDLCSADKKTLITCSLVSRAWVYRTRKHLFSTLELTDKTLITWSRVILAPLPRTTRPHTSSPYPSSWLPTCVTTLKLFPTYSPASNNFEAALIRANAHLSAFTNLKTLTLSAVWLQSFREASLGACFGSLAKTVRELKLSMCSLGEKFFAFLKLFTHLESLELDENIWIRGDAAEPLRSGLPEDLPTLRGSFAISNSTNKDDGLVDFLITARVEHHAITIGYIPTSAFPTLNALFAKCKNHLMVLTFTNVAPVSLGVGTNSAFDLSPCRKLVGIHAQSNYAWFGFIFIVLGTISSRRFRKLTIDIARPGPKINPEDWGLLDKGVFELAKRVKATAGNNMLEVLIRCSTTVGGIQLSEIEGALPLVSSDVRVSLRTEHLPPAFIY